MTNEETTSMKVKLDVDTASKLKECEKLLQKPMAEVIRLGIRKMYKKLHK